MERIGRGVRREMGRFGPAGAMGEIVSSWPEAVGPSIAANAWPARVTGETLHVATSSSAWAFELTQLAATILPRLKEAVGTAAPTALRFAPGRLPEQPADALPAGETTAPRPSASERAQAEEIASGMTNEGLRELVARAASASLARVSDDRRF